MHNRMYRCRKGNEDASESYADLTMASLRKSGLLGDNICHTGTLFWYRRERLILEALCTFNTRDKNPSFSIQYGSYKAEIALTFTRPNYGGKRWWFTCPMSGCGKRVGVLYLRKGEIGCRHCHRLVYVTQYESLATRQILRAKQLHCELGGNGSLTSGIPPRPKGQHHTTYETKALALISTFYEGNINMMKTMQKEVALYGKQ